MSAPKLSAAERLRIAREKNPLPSSAPALALAVKPELPTITAPVAVTPLQLAGPAAQLQLTGPAAPLKLAGPVSPDPGKGLEPAPVGALYSQLAAVSVVRARQGHSPELRPRLSPDAPPAQAQRDEQRAGERGGVHAANAGTPGAAERLRLAREANPLERLGQGAAPAYPTGPSKGVVRTEAGLVLRPCYEWQELPEGVSVPPGLDIEMPLDGKPRQARIPPRWQLKVSTAEHGFWRHEVTKLSSALELRQSAATHVGLPLDAVLLRFAGASVEDSATVEELGLFGRERELLVVTQ